MLGRGPKKGSSGTICLRVDPGQRQSRNAGVLRQERLQAQVGRRCVGEHAELARAVPGHVDERRMVEEPEAVRFGFPHDHVGNARGGFVVSHMDGYLVTRCAVVVVRQPERPDVGHEEPRQAVFAHEVTDV